MNSRRSLRYHYDSARSYIPQNFEVHGVAFVCVGARRVAAQPEFDWPGSLRGSLMKKLVSVLAKISQRDRILILFLTGRAFKKQGSMRAGRKLASSASA
jgi:hypothetical protein